MDAQAERRLGLMLAIGAVYDLVFAVAILLLATPAAAILGLPLPNDRVYLQLNGIFLLILGAIYLAASRDPGRYPAVAPISAAGRVLGFLLFAWTWRGGRPSTFLALGLADLAIAVATLSAWRRARLK